MTRLIVGEWYEMTDLVGRTFQLIGLDAAARAGSIRGIATILEPDVPGTRAVNVAVLSTAIRRCQPPRAVKSHKEVK